MLIAFNFRGEEMGGALVLFELACRDAAKSLYLSPRRGVERSATAEKGGEVDAENSNILSARGVTDGKMTLGFPRFGLFSLASS